MSLPRPWRQRRDAAAVIAQLHEGRLSQFGAAEADAAILILKQQAGIVG